MRLITEICFFCFLVWIFYEVGRLLALSVRSDLKHSFAICSAAGVSTITIAVTLLYKLGTPVQVSFWVASAFAALSRLSAFRSGMKPWRAGATPSRAVLLSSAAALALLLPAVTGGPRFSLFRGCHQDAYDYLESAVSIRNASYSTLQNESPVRLTQRDLFAVAKDTIGQRPAICILYASLSTFRPAAFLDLHYVMLVYFEFLSTMLLYELTRVFLPERPVWGLLLAVSLAGGFWGQWILDIDAWSQNAFMPLLLGMVLLVTGIASAATGTAGLMVPVQSLGLFALLATAAFYLYPEGSLFVLPPLLFGLFLLVLVSRVRVRVMPLLFAACLAGCLIYVIRENNVYYLTGQASTALSRSVGWWKFYDAYLSGRDGWNEGFRRGFFADSVDFVSGLMGLYFLTPTHEHPATGALSVRILLLSVITLLLGGAVRYRRELPAGPGTVLAGIVLICILETVWLVEQKQYWTAGKALSYFVYLPLLLFCAPSLRPHGTSRSWWNAAHFGAVASLVVSGLLLVAYRGIAAGRPYGIHYSRPYPSLQKPYLKQEVDYSDSSFLQHLNPKDMVAVEIPNPWIQFFVRMELAANNIPFCVLPPVYLHSSINDTMNDYVHPPITCEVALKEQTDSLFLNRLVLLQADELKNRIIPPAPLGGFYGVENDAKVEFWTGTRKSALQISQLPYGAGSAVLSFDLRTLTAGAVKISSSFPEQHAFHFEPGQVHHFEVQVTPRALPALLWIETDAEGRDLGKGAGYAQMSFVSIANIHFAASE